MSQRGTRVALVRAPRHDVRDDATPTSVDLRSRVIDQCEKHAGNSFVEPDVIARLFHRSPGRNG